MAGYGENDTPVAFGGYGKNDKPVDAVAPKPAGRTIGGTLGDIGVTALKGAVALPQAVVGLADIPTGGRVGKALEGIGYRPGETQKTLDSMYSAPQQEANKYVAEGEGFTDTLKRAIERPSVIAKTVGESIPMMLGGAGIARGLIKGGEVVGKKVAPWAAGALGEGAIGAGSAAEGVREESADGLLTGKQSLAALGSGAGTALFGAVGGKLSTKLGLGDVDTMLAQGGANAVAAGAAKQGFMRQVIGSGIAEGVFEELPQSVQEQMWQNFATDKPLTEGVGNAAALGLLAGGVMGGAGGGYNAIAGKLDAQPEATPRIAGRLPQPIETGTPSDRLAQAEVARANEMASAQANADAIYGARDAFEAAKPAPEQAASAPEFNGFTPEETAAFRQQQAANQRVMANDLEIQRATAETAAKEQLGTGAIGRAASAGIDSGAVAPEQVLGIPSIAAGIVPQAELAAPASQPQATEAAPVLDLSTEMLAEVAAAPAALTANKSEDIAGVATAQNGADNGTADAAPAALAQTGGEVRSNNGAQGVPDALVLPDRNGVGDTAAGIGAGGRADLPAGPSDRNDAVSPVIARVGTAPNSAQPVTVRRGVVHIGEAATDIMVPEGATLEQVADALRNTLPVEQRIYEGAKGMRQVRAPAKPRQPERRADNARRQLVSEMDADTLRRELLTDPLTGIGNRRAYDESEKLAVQVVIDADSLKWVNDNLGHASGDKLLKAVGQAISEETQNAYHVSGDEFIVQAETAAEAQAIMARAVVRMESARIDATNADGQDIVLTGVGVSYGIAGDLHEAEKRLGQHKAERETQGQRAARGETPPNAAIGSARGEDQPGDAAAEARRVARPKKTLPPAKTADEFAERARKEFIKIIKDMGGISAAESRDITGEPAHIANRMAPGLFRIAGNALDLVARRLNEAGYISDADYNDVDGGVQAVRELVNQALGKEAVMNGADQERYNELLQQEQRLAEQEAELVADMPARNEALAEILAEEADDIAFGDDFTPGDTAADMRAMGFTEDEINAELTKEQGAEAAGGTAAGRAGEGGQIGQGQEAVGAGAREDGGFDLAGQSPAEVAAAEKRTRQAAADKADADAKAEARAKADRERADFGLTGSDRAADADTNQGDLLSNTINQDQIDSKATPAPLTKEADKASQPVQESPASTEPEQPTESNKQSAIDAIKESDIPVADQIRLTAELRKGEVTPDDVMNVVGKVEAAPAKQSTKEAKPEKAVADDKKQGKTVENFGEALPPARRAMAAKLDESLSDGDIAARPLSEIWPQAENDAIEDTFAAAVAFAARAEIPAKPRVGYKVKQWVAKVQGLRELAAKIVSGRVSRDEFINASGAYSLRDWIGKVKLLEQLPREQWKRVETVEERPDAYTYQDGVQVQTPMLRLVIDGKLHYLRNDGTVAGNMDGIAALLDDAAPEKRMEFEIRHPRSGGKFFINKKGDGQYRRLMEFDTVEEARSAISNQYDALVGEWENVKARDNITERDLRSAENRPRVGKDHRGGRDVTPEKFQTAFGFRGGEFGKWVQQGKGDKNRQAILNSAFDALHDLAEIVGVPPGAISLNGTLGIAFGSRGSGWASAHFEPSNLVINLTKTRGAGALAHEWFHALDNYFSRLRGGEVAMSVAGSQKAYRDSNYITHKPEPLMVRKDGKPYERLTLGKLKAMHEARKHQTDAYNPDHWQRDPKHREGVRPEVEQRFAALVEALNESPMTKRARLLDGKKSGDGYWSSTLERAARTFENYIQARMLEDGYHNDFLANVKAASETGKNDARYPYLMPGEIKPISEAFDALFGEIQTKETDTGTAMFSRTTEQPAFYSQLSRAFEQAKQESMPAGMWKAWLNSNAANLGIKKDEIEWSGIGDYLDMQGKGKVAKADVLGFLSENGVRIEDVQLGGRVMPEKIKRDYIAAMIRQGATEKDAGLMWNEMWFFANDKTHIESAKDRGFRIVMEDGANTGNEIHDAVSDTSDAKFEQYTPPGGIPGTYREILVTLPTENTRLRNEGDRIGRLENPTLEEIETFSRANKAGMEKGSVFTSSHFDQPNILVHLRTDEVTGADGKRYLRVVEVQSDWGQKGKKEGFDPAEKIEGLTTTGIPLAPFVTDTKAWVSLGIKRAIQQAVSSGVDGIVFATGQQNADLYDLSKQVQRVDVSRPQDGSFAVYAYQNKTDTVPAMQNRVSTESELADLLGKDFAEKVAKQPIGTKRDYTGLDLKVGGEGMRAFYDTIVPSVANDVLKKLGGKVEQIAMNGPATAVKMPHGWVMQDVDGNQVAGPKSSQAAVEALYQAEFKGTQPGFLIPESLKAKVQTEGLPMFQRGLTPAESVKRVVRVQAIVNGIKAKWRNAPEIIVIADMQDAKVPQRVRDLDAQMKSNGASGEPRGFISAGKVYIVAGQHKSVEDVITTVAHELGHAGLRGLYGEALAPILRQIVTMRRAEVNAKVKEYGFDPESDRDLLRAAEEVLANMAETRPEMGFVKRAIAAIRNWLRGNGLNLKLTDADIIANWILPARAFIENGAKPVGLGRSLQAAFSRSNQTESAAFKKWFGGSKVVDADGKPLVVFHGSGESIGAFDPSKSNTGAFFFTANPSYAASHAAQIKGLEGGYLNPSYLALKNPKTITATDADFSVPGYEREQIAIAKEEGHDGVIFQGSKNTFYAAFDSRQVKSYNNKGTFDPTNPDIMFSRTTLDDAMSKLRQTFGQPRTESASAYAEQNRRIREEHVTAWDKGRKWLKRQLSPAGLLPQSVFDIKIDRDANLEAIEFDVAHMVGALERAVKADYKVSANKLDETTQRLLSEVMAGKIGDVPAATKTALLGMRQYIDKMTVEYLNLLETQRQDLLAAAERSGDNRLIGEAAERAGLIEAITANVGQYVHRSYRAFDDADWALKVPDTVLDDARAYLLARYAEDGTPNAANRVEVVLNEILKHGTAYESIEAFVKESKLGAKDLSVLKKRKQIAPEIRALLGEYTDPRIGFAKSATKMSRLIFNQRFLDRVRELGMGQFLFTDDNKPPEATVKIAGEQSDTYAPLNGLWTTPETNQAFKDALGKEQMADWYRTIVKMNGMVKFGKTVLSPTTAARNWMSAFFFTVANGHFDMSHMAKSVSLLKEYFGHRSDADKLAYLRELKVLGVIYDTPYAGEMMRLLADTNTESMLNSGKGLPLKKALDYATKFYQYGDDFWKVIGFENEKRMLIDAGYTEADAKKEAAARIRDTYPTYSMVGRGIQSLRRFPLAGSFVSFPAEIIRTSYNMLRYLEKDYKNPAMRSRAIKRATGLAIASSFAYALQAVSMAMLGYDDDDEEAVRLMAAPWQKNSNLLFTGRDAEGKIRFLDLSFLDPYNYWKRPIIAVTRGQPWREAVKDVADETLSPFFGTDIAAGAIFDAMANKKDSGGTVYNEHDAIGSQLADIGNHLRKALQPGLFANMERTYKALNGDVTASGKQYDVADEALGWVGFRVATLDPKVALFYRSFDFRDAKQNAEKHMRDALRDPGDVSGRELRNAYNMTVRLRDEAFSDMQLLVKASMESGLTRQEIHASLKNSGVSQKDIFALMSGRVPAYMMSPESVMNIAKKSRDTFGPDASKRVIDRYREVRSYDSNG